jgi:hypothetical protein
MTQLFRAMKEEDDGMPETGPSARTLGARPGIDVPSVDPNDVISPGQGGLSVSPDDPLGLPVHRRPPELQGTGKDPVWSLAVSDLGPDLIYRPDPKRPDHGFIEPARPMSLDEFQRALAQTRDLWQKVPAPASGGASP